MLPKTFRFVAVNNTGQSLVFDSLARLSVTYEAWKFNSSGALVYASEVTTGLDTFGSGETITDGSASDFGTNQDNSSNLNLGINGTFEVTQPNNSADGSVDLYYEYSTDGGTDFPGNRPEVDIEAELTLVATITFAASGVKATNFSI